MAYEITWYIPGKVLLLHLHGDYTLRDAEEVNRLITQELMQSQAPLSVLIDATKMNRPYNFGDIRATQTYMGHQQLKHIYVAADDRLVKLAMMVIFNLSRALLHMFDDLDKATHMVQRQMADPH